MVQWGGIQLVYIPPEVRGGKLFSNLMGTTDNKMIETRHAKYRLRGRLYEALGEKKNVLIAAPTSLGKTHTIATLRWLERPDMTGGKQVIHVSPSTKTRDQAFQMSEDTEGVTPVILKGREEACSMAKGDFDDRFDVPGESITPSEWFNRKCDAAKVPFSDAHEQFREMCGPLPCEQGGGCDAITQWHAVFGSSSPQYDVLHVTQPFVYNSELVNDANVIFDEQPKFTIGVMKEVRPGQPIERAITRNKIQEAITDLLSHVDGNISTWESLLAAFENGDSNALRDCEHRLSEFKLSSSWMFRSGDAHALAPAIVRAIINAEDVGNGYRRGVGQYRPKEIGLNSAGETNVIVVFDEKNRLKLIHNAPDLSGARCVIGLDAHPTEQLWQFQTTQTFSQQSLLDSEEDRNWRRYERGLEVYQIGEYTRSYTQGWAGQTNVERERTKRRAEALLKAMREKFGDEFRTCISSNSTEDNVKQVMEDMRIDNPKVMHYGAVKSRDDFKYESVGLLIGCIDPGDHNILGTIALLDLRAEAVMEETDDGDTKRAPGRGFEGPDSDAALEILESVRKKNVAQAIGRYARSAHDSHTQGAKVYVWTDAIPEDMIDYEVPGVEHIYINKAKRIIELAQQAGGRITARELVKEFEEDNPFEDSVSKWHVQQTLNELVDQGTADGFEGDDSDGKYGADEYVVSASAGTATVDLEPTIAN